MNPYLLSIYNIYYILFENFESLSFYNCQVIFKQMKHYDTLIRHIVHFQNKKRNKKDMFSFRGS